MIYWKSGGGRGNRSKLQFKRSLQEVIPPYFRMLVKQGEFKEAVRLIKRKGIPADVRQSCYTYMMKELSFPMIDWSEPSRTLTPTMVATTTGRWFFVKGDK
ncbi:SgrR family transcriptional regulator [Polycladomyces abyssicola]|uniref:SgrR family transcriptional regulator n=1 Tax=Polycladomyces abyssicola TaxID=1125966 RepID=UPI001BB2E86B|nr:SgrR family transcriptional regulator [Polycladomyces abyssicola]